MIADPQPSFVQETGWVGSEYADSYKQVVAEMPADDRPRVQCVKQDGTIETIDEGHPKPRHPSDPYDIVHFAITGWEDQISGADARYRFAVGDLMADQATARRAK